MSQEEAFLRAILAAPNDPTLRLVFADWLEETDHAEQAEIIRLQHALNTSEGKDRRWRREVEARLRGLQRTHEDPLKGLRLFRGELQWCRLAWSGWLHRCWRLHGRVEAEVEFSARRPSQKLSVNGQIVLANWHDFLPPYYFQLPAPGRPAFAHIDIRIHPWLVVRSLQLVVEDEVWYSEPD